MSNKIISFEKFKTNEDFYNPFDKKEVKKDPVSMSDQGGHLKLRKETYNPSRIEWTKRPGGGYTVLARTQFARGEIVEICPVIILDELAKTVDRLKDIIFELDSDEGKWGLALGYGSLYKHHEKANCEYAYNKLTKQMHIITKKTIKVGEELSINYGNDYWTERMNFNLTGKEERTDQNQGMPTVNNKAEESEIQPNKADIQNTGNIKSLSSPNNPHNPVRTGVAIKGMGQQ